MRVQQQLEQMRELLYQAPQAERWWALLELFEGWPHEEGFSVALDYADTHLSAWPDGLRVAPRTWVERLLEGKRPHRAWPLVRSVSLARHGLGPEDAWCLARQRSMACVTQLDLSGNHLRTEGARYLARSPHLGALRLLLLQGNDMDAEGLVWLSQSQSSFALTLLELGSNDINDEGLRALCGSALLDSLEQLSLSVSWRYQRRHWSPITLEGWRALLRRGAPRLRRLDLSGHRIGAQGVVELAHSGALPKLEELDLSYVRDLDSQSLFALLAAEGLPHLRKLTLRGGARLDPNSVASMRRLLSQRSPQGILHL